MQIRKKLEIENICRKSHFFLWLTIETNKTKWKIDPKYFLPPKTPQKIRTPEKQQKQRNYEVSLCPICHFYIVAELLILTELLPIFNTLRISGQTNC